MGVGKDSDAWRLLVETTRIRQGEEWFNLHLNQVKRMKRILKYII